jgi:ABC-type transporter Mla MlaB component
MDHELLFLRFNMLRVTSQVNGAETILIIEGKLVGPWVTELASCWHAAVARSSQVVVKLSSVSFIDEAGRRLLAEMHLLGTKMIAEECLTRSIIETITRPVVSSVPPEC